MKKELTKKQMKERKKRKKQLLIAIVALVGCLAFGVWGDYNNYKKGTMAYNLELSRYNLLVVDYRNIVESDPDLRKEGMPEAKEVEYIQPAGEKFLPYLEDRTKTHLSKEYDTIIQDLVPKREKLQTQLEEMKK